MAYAAAVTVEKKVISGRRTLVIAVAETEAAAASEFEVPCHGITEGTITCYRATLTAGTGTTINPIVGRAAGFAADTQDHVGTNNTTAAHIPDTSNLRFYIDALGSLWIRSTVNDATADHSISTEITISEGHL